MIAWESPVSWARAVPTAGTRVAAPCPSTHPALPRGAGAVSGRVNSSLHTGLLGTISLRAVLSVTVASQAGMSLAALFLLRHDFPAS